MNILFTGASSFTGARFVRELAAAGHRVVVVLRKSVDGYGDDPIRQARVTMATAAAVQAVPHVAFGDEAFLDLVRSRAWDVLCHHAADVTNYKSPDFDPVAALANNTHGLVPALRALKSGGCGKVVLTGSVFEGGEGAGSQGLPDFSPYGLSKRLTAEVFRYHCEREGLRLGKFVIPNPFGPHEGPRFTSYLMTNWLAGKRPNCSSPRYVRDNVPVSLLAKCYAQFVSTLPDGPGFSKTNPTGYAETQGAFTLRLAQEMRTRLDLPCPVDLLDQTDFPEPHVRVNTDVPDLAALAWDESAAWDEMAAYYQGLAR